MRTKRQHTYTFPHIWPIFPLASSFSATAAILPKNTLLLGYESNVKTDSHSHLIYSPPFYCVGHVAELAGRPRVQWSNTWASESGGLGFFRAVPYHFVAVDKPQFSHLPNGDNNSSSCGLVTVRWRHLAQGLGHSVCSINVSSIRFTWVKGESPLRAGGSLSSSLESSSSARNPARGHQGGLVSTGIWGSAFIPQGRCFLLQAEWKDSELQKVPKQCILNSLS